MMELKPGDKIRHRRRDQYGVFLEDLPGDEALVRFEDGSEQRVSRDQLAKDGLMDLQDARKIFKIRMTLRPARHRPHPDDSLSLSDWRRSWAKKTGNIVERLTLPH